MIVTMTLLGMSYHNKYVDVATVVIRAGKIFQYYISITIVQSYTGKYHEFVAVCIVTWYYGDNNFIIRTSDFIACSYTAHVTCST